MSEKFQENVTVLKQQCIGKDIYDMTIQTKHIAGHAKAGQFVSLYSNDASKLLHVRSACVGLMQRQEHFVWYTG